jgi:hypothetical protein
MHWTLHLMGKTWIEHTDRKELLGEALDEAGVVA